MRSVERRAAPGEELIRAGDRGDRFYVVLEGAVEVHLHGVLRRLEGRGEYFGEIALLHDVPRTADVRAHEPSLLLAFGRQDFLAAVTGQARALATADAVAERRLAADTDTDTDTDA